MRILLPKRAAHTLNPSRQGRVRHGHAVGLSHTWPAVSQICALIVLPSTCGAPACPESARSSTSGSSTTAVDLPDAGAPCFYLGTQVNSGTQAPLSWVSASLFLPFQLLHLASASYTCMLRVANSTPIVDLLSRENSLRVNRLSRLDFPTPESPISTTLNK